MSSSGFAARAQAAASKNEAGKGNAGKQAGLYSSADANISTDQQSKLGNVSKKGGSGSGVGGKQ